MELNAQAVLALAPDPSSAAAGKKNSSAKLWKGLGANDSAFWGECQGSAVYQVKVDRRQFAFNCSCPSRKLPCKHVLGLLLLACDSINSLSENTPPEWVSTWLEKRDATAKKKEEKAAAPPAEKEVDEAAKAKRVEKRAAAVLAGLDQLELFLADFVRQGLAAIERKAYELCENQAKRLVDAQARGLANRVKRIAEIPASGGNWTERMLGEMSRLQLLVHAARRQDQLRPQLAAEIRQMIGWNVSQEELAAHADQVEDNWLVVAIENDVEEKLRVQKVWLYGATSKEFAYYLQFAPGTMPFNDAFMIGSKFKAKATFYPGVTRMRVSLGIKGSSNQVDFSLDATNIEENLERASTRLSQNPWLDETPISIKDAVVNPTESGEWFVIDSTGDALPLRRSEYWSILALTGGHPATLFGTWSFGRVNLLSLQLGESIFDVAPPVGV